MDTHRVRISNYFSVDGKTRFFGSGRNIDLSRAKPSYVADLEKLDVIRRLPGDTINEPPIELGDTEEAAPIAVAPPAPPEVAETVIEDETHVFEDFDDDIPPVQYESIAYESLDIDFDEDEDEEPTQDEPSTKKKGGKK